MATPPPETVNRTYRIGPWRRSGLWWCLGPVLLGGITLLALGGEGNRSGGFALVLASAPWLVWWHWYVNRLRLELSPCGVHHRHGRLVLEAVWSEVERLRLDRGREGFVVRSPLEGKAAARLAARRGIVVQGQPWYDDEQRALIAERRFIPIDPFAWLIKKGRLLRDLDEFAPALAASVRAEQERRRLAEALPKPPLTGRQLWRNSLIGLSMAIPVGLGLLFALSESPAVDRFERWFFALANAVGSSLMLCVAATSAWNGLRARAWMLAALFAVLAPIVLFWCLGSWGWVIELSAGSPGP